VTLNSRRHQHRYRQEMSSAEDFRPRRPESMAAAVSCPFLVCGPLGGQDAQLACVPRSGPGSRRRCGRMRRGPRLCMLAALFATLAGSDIGWWPPPALGGRSVDQHFVHPSPKLRVRAAELLIQPASGLVLLSAGSSVASGLEAHEKGGHESEGKYSAECRNR
jgi:hypothetical protein